MSNLKCYLMVLIVMTALIPSCGRRTKETSGIGRCVDTVFFFTGKFMYYADAPVLRDCATGFMLTVAQERDYLRAERNYMDMDPSQGEYIYVEFMGSIAESILENGEGLPYTVHIDSLIGFDRYGDCDFKTIIPGVYDSEMARLRSNLRLTGNYEFIHTVFEMDMEGDTDIYTGRWGRTAEKEVVLIYEMFNGKKYSEKKQLHFDHDNDMLIGVENGDTVIFKKTYL